MAKGKKFDAAQVHFEKKRIVLSRQNAELQQRFEQEHNRRVQLEKLHEALVLENTELRNKLYAAEKLLNMSPEELEKHMEETKRSAELAGMLKFITHGGMYE